MFRDLNGSTADFQTDDDIPDLQEKSNAGKEKKKKGKGKKRKATESVEEESDEGRREKEIIRKEGRKIH